MKDYLTILAALLFCVATPLQSQSQEDYILSKDELSTHIVNLSFNRGFLMTHYDLMDYYLENKTLGIKLSIEKVLKGGWTDSYSHITRGIEIYRTSLGNNEILGHATHLIGYGNIGIHSKGKGRLKMGAGIAVLTEKFDLDKNIKNANIGSNLNAGVVFEYSFPFIVKGNMAISPSIRFTHYSNGSYKLPNLGLNVVSAGIGIERHLVNESIVSDVVPKSLEKQRLSTGITIGRSQYSNPESDIYNNYNFNLHYINSSRSKLIWGIGTDIHYNESYHNYAKNDPNSKNSLTALESTRTGLTGITGFTLGATEIHINVGYYLYDKQKLDGALYQRLYLLTRLGSGFRFKVAIKAHNAKAETVEIGINKDLWKN